MGKDIETQNDMTQAHIEKSLLTSAAFIGLWGLKIIRKNGELELGMRSVGEMGSRKEWDIQRKKERERERRNENPSMTERIFRRNRENV